MTSAASTAAAGGTRRAAPTRRTVVTLTLLALLVALLAVIPALTSDYGLLVAYQVLQLAALAAAWNLMAGYGGLVTLAVAAFVGLGSYTTAKLSLSAGFGVLPSVLAGGVLAAAFAAIISVPMFRFRGLYFTIGTLVLAEALRIFMVNYNGLGGATGLTLSGTAPSLTTLYYLVLVLAVAASVMTFVLLRTVLGMGLVAIRDDEDVAQEVGVSTFRTKLVAFVLSGLVMGLAGGIQAQRLGHIEPYGSFSLQWTIDTVNATILGGLGTVLGPLVGAAAAVQLSERLANYPEWHVAITGALLILVIRFAPRGIWGTALLGLRGWLPGWIVPREAGAALDLELPVPAEPDSPEPLTATSVARAPARRAVARAAPGEILLEAKGVGIAFGGVRANDDVELAVRAGEVVGIVGPNGAGKSTFIGLISGVLISDQGPIHLFGQDATHVPAAVRARTGVGRTHQVPRPFARMTVEENLLVAQLHGAGAGAAEARVETRRILARCGLAEVADVPAGDLPLLRLKRLELARALALKPRLLLLDEIGAGLVESELRELIALIQELTDEVEAMIIVEHVIDVIRECCDRLVVLDRGRKLTEGDPDEVFADPEVAAVYLGTGVAEEHVVRAPKHRVGEQPLLAVEGVSAAYGHFQALRDVSLAVHAGEVVALLGVNGAGKTTTARVISGLLAPTGGAVRFDGATLTGRPAHEMVGRGIAHCMEGRRIFGDLSVEENLLLGGASAPAGERARRLEEIYELFDVLREKRADSGKSMSGGQQQMLAIGRALMAGPRLAIFDEISLGLAPVAVDRLYEALAEVNQRGVAMIVIEQNVERGLALADRVYVIEKGRIALSGTPEQVRRDPRLLALYVGEAKGAA